VDTVGLQFSWRCSTLFLAAIAGVGWSVAASGRFGTRAVKLGVAAWAAATAVVRETAGTVLTFGGFVEVKADHGLAARCSAWVLVGAILRLMVRARTHRTMWLS